MQIWTRSECQQPLKCASFLVVDTNKMREKKKSTISIEIRSDREKESAERGRMISHHHWWSAQEATNCALRIYRVQVDWHRINTMFVWCSQLKIITFISLKCVNLRRVKTIKNGFFSRLPCNSTNRLKLVVGTLWIYSRFGECLLTAHPHGDVNEETSCLSVFMEIFWCVRWIMHFVRKQRTKWLLLHLAVSSGGKKRGSKSSAYCTGANLGHYRRCHSVHWTKVSDSEVVCRVAPWVEHKLGFYAKTWSALQIFILKCTCN